MDCLRAVSPPNGAFLASLRSACQYFQLVQYSIYISSARKASARNVNFDSEYATGLAVSGGDIFTIQHLGDFHKSSSKIYILWVSHCQVHIISWFFWNSNFLFRARIRGRLDIYQLRNIFLVYILTVITAVTNSVTVSHFKEDFCSLERGKFRVTHRVALPNDQDLCMFIRSLEGLSISQFILFFVTRLH